MIRKSNLNFATVLFAIFIPRLNALAENIENFGPCTTPNLEHAFCIHLEECTYLYKMLTKQPILDADRTFLANSQCGFKNGSILICCPERQIGVQIPMPDTRGRLPEPSSCSGNVISNRIYGGNVTELGEHPYTVLIEYDKGENRYGFQCGGSLINDRYVLTAAHCISAIPKTWTPYRVRLGEWNLSTDRDCMSDLQTCADPHIDVTIEKATPHEKYGASLKNQPHDIALLRLSRSITYTNYIRPICLPQKTTLKRRRSSFVGNVMEVSGWGKTQNGTPSDVKLKAELEVVPLSDCQRVYSQLGFDLQSSQMCAGGQQGIDTCRGDSGGPLVGLESTSEMGIYYFLAGVVSFGATPCGLQGWPGVYTRVSDYVDWIHENIEP